VELSFFFLEMKFERFLFGQQNFSQDLRSYEKKAMKMKFVANKEGRGERVTL